MWGFGCFRHVAPALYPEPCVGVTADAPPEPSVLGTGIRGGGSVRLHRASAFDLASRQAGGVPLVSRSHLALMSNTLQSQNKPRPLASAGLSVRAVDGNEQGGWRSKAGDRPLQHVVSGRAERGVKSWERGDCSGAPVEGRIGPFHSPPGSCRDVSGAAQQHQAPDLLPHTLFSAGAQRCQPGSWRRRPPP